MAVLSVDSLTGCSSIPDFLGGTSDTPANPSKTIFHNTNAPTSWVKDTSHNNKSLRVIGGANGAALSNAGTNPFTTVFNPRTSPVSSDQQPANASLTPATTGFTQTNPGSFGADNATLSTAQYAPHQHAISFNPGTSPSTVNGSTSSTAATDTPATTGPGGGPGSHGHTTPSTSHSHPLSDPGHTHPVNSSGPHAHTFTLNQNFNILYVDVIIATKS